MPAIFSRRAFSALLLPAAAGAQRNKRDHKPAPALPYAGEFVRFADALTENPVVRLTSVNSASYLPLLGARFLSARERALVFTSDRFGSVCPFAMDLRSGIASQLAITRDLRQGAVEMTASGRSAYLLDGDRLKEVELSNKRVKEIADGVSGFSAAGHGPDVVWVRGGRLYRSSEPERVWAEDVGSFCLVQPNGNGCMFTRKSAPELCYVAFARASSTVVLAAGQFASPSWSPDSRSVLLLRNIQLEGGLQGSEVHEIALPDRPDTTELIETFVSKTSRFAVFAPNGDGSVFVGASRSRAQPAIVILVRSLRRELTLCEHHASDPASVNPSFSPDSRRVFFQSDFQGKPAIFAVNVEQIVEPTSS